MEKMRDKKVEIICIAWALGWSKALSKAVIRSQKAEEFNAWKLGFNIKDLKPNA